MIFDTVLLGFAAMKITFIYTDYGRFNSNNINLGISVLSACLKQAGYATSLIHISSNLKENSFAALIKQHNPDIIAVSFISNMFPQIKRFAGWINKIFRDLPVIYGGLHPTVAPEECLATDGMKVICRGEGEGAMVDFCEAIKNKRAIKNIPNLWVKEKDIIHRNQCRALVSKLDSLPFRDYDLFQYEELEEALVNKALITHASRGCYYNCTYCCNHVLKLLYPNPSKDYVRFYGVDRLLDELEYYLKKYSFLNNVRFNDDALTCDKNWFREFAQKYKKRINLPYSGNDRVENITSETAELLKFSGCASLDFGIENGDEIFRKEIMKRHNSNNQIIASFKILNSYGIKTNAFNIIGMPGETPQTVLKTIKLNAIVKPSITFNAYFYPFKGTEAYKTCKAKGYAIEENIGGFFEKPSVRLDTIEVKQAVFYYRYFRTLMRIYGLFLKSLSTEPKASGVLDKIFTSKYFPYGFLNMLHFGKEDLIAILRKSPWLYVFIRGIYRLTRKSPS